MSLKAFHIVFISASALLCFGLALWLLMANSHPASPSSPVGAVVALLVGSALVVYGVRFLRKFKKVSFF